ncbi:MAG TPA: Y-family DNA polymerase [Bacteroidales bacterium]|nr:Y-family DNA polymerase [Bacteroidales bacterium]HOH83134.1 Y-family DNA polymerase [Bacteroidales bacterium]
MNLIRPNKDFPKPVLNKVFALVDCNNFYASCERLFNPKLEKKPLIVLSNNDGCVIARSNEAKSIGIKMGAPAFEFKELIARHGVHVFSSNYALYGDISNRIMAILFEMAPEVEVYSVDEAFLNLSGMDPEAINLLAANIRKTIKKWVGIPVSVGIGPTKTLAKIANHLAKKNPAYANVANLCSIENTDDVLKQIPVSEVWGIGQAYSDILTKKGMQTVLDFKNADEHWVRRQMHVVGHKTLLELRGISCIPLESMMPDKKNICISRSFGSPLQQYEDLEQAITTFAARAAEKLRQQQSCARGVLVFVMTNRFSSDPKYVKSTLLQMPVSTNITAEIIHQTLKGLKKIYRKGYLYKKCGVILTDIIPDNQLQYTLWDNTNREKLCQLMETVDKINGRIGQGAIKFAVQGTKRRWKMHQERLSPHYTSKWNDILTIKI